MTIFDAPRPDAGADDGLDHEADRQTTGRWSSRPGPDNTPPQWLVLKRGEERLALFRGWPEPGLELTFRRTAMVIGLALEGQDLAEPGRFDDCSYVFIGGNHRPESAFAEAIRDLRRAGWTVDQAAVWPVIIGGYKSGPAGGAEKNQRLSPATTRDSQEGPEWNLEMREG